MFGFNLFPEPMRPFNTTYRCFSVSMLPGNERMDVEKGGKIIMPPSALDHLTRLNIVYPMLFKLSNKKEDRMTHSGVLEFVADEGKVYIPYWMMRNLLLDEGGLIQIESISLPVASFSKFQPQSVEFLDITNPKAVLENALRNFACLTTGDIVALSYNDRIYELLVLETKPGQAVSIIECDMNVDFAPPVGYKEPEREPSKISVDENQLSDADLRAADSSFYAFTGHGNRLDGKVKPSSDKENGTSQPNPIPIRRGIPDYDYQVGTLRFIRNIRAPTSTTDNSKDDFSAFSGQGKSLREKRA